MDFESIINKRFSVRKYRNDQIEEEKLNKILEAGRLAPTAKNNQPHKIVVIKSVDGLTKVDNACPCRYNAPTVIAMCVDESKCFGSGENSTAKIDSTIVLTHMMLAATSVGVDSTWIQMFDKDKLKQELELPDNLQIVSLLNLGYRTDDCPDSPNHLVRKDLSEIVEYK